MINNIINSQKVTNSSEMTASTSSFTQKATQVTVPKLYNCDNDPINHSFSNIQNYQIDKLKEVEVFSRMKTGIPSVLDFLKLCSANDQQLAANYLRCMLKKEKNINIYKWVVNVISERNCSFDNYKNNLDVLGTPLTIAAKYGNTAICKVLIEKQKYKEVSFLTKMYFMVYDFFNMYSILFEDEATLLMKYKCVRKQENSKYYFSALEKAIEYNNFETAEYIYNLFKGVSVSEDYSAEKLIYMLDKIKNTSQLDFVLQKIGGLCNNYILSRKLICVCVLWGEEDKWDIISYFVNEHIDIIEDFTKASICKIQIILYEALKNKKFDIVSAFIKNMPRDIFYKIFSDHTFLERVSEGCNYETNDWLNKAISDKKASI
jgi:hypothetical protein